MVVVRGEAGEGVENRKCSARAQGVVVGEEKEVAEAVVEEGGVQASQATQEKDAKAAAVAVVLALLLRLAATTATLKGRGRKEERGESIEAGLETALEGVYTAKESRSPHPNIPPLPPPAEVFTANSVRVLCPTSGSVLSTPPGMALALTLLVMGLPGAESGTGGV